MSSQNSLSQHLMSQNSASQPKKKRNPRHQWESVEDFINVVRTGDSKIDYVNLNFQAQLRYGRHIQNGSISKSAGGNSYIYKDHLDCKHTFKIQKEGIEDPHWVLYRSANTFHVAGSEGSIPIPPARGVHPTVKSKFLMFLIIVLRAIYNFFD